ncbi:MAG: electron transfer flavoprotein subunit alpha/FixB family protein [Propionibacteriaceae bacterium]|jgi:electron transfer flavoprotein alpha subunit|nr:electron transfer flavoprotein subunit alpha/FixB family protein [Propionibacteriaceae bacterium]
MTKIWVIAHDDTVAADLVRSARGLGSYVGTVCIGGHAVPGADLTLTAPQIPETLIEGYSSAIAEVVKDGDLVIFSTDTQSRLLAGLVASTLKTSVRNITSISAEGDTFTITRPLYGGLAVVTETLGSGASVLVVGPGALPEYEGDLPSGEVKDLEGTPSTPGLKVVETRTKQVQAVNLAAAKRVIGVGRGFAQEADLEMARELAAKLGGELACSRPMAEGVNWMPVECYLGVSGATIRPDLYLAIGISGQIQHMVGVNRSKVIVAINKDKNAPIFTHADYGVVGDLYDVLPALIQAL